MGISDFLLIQNHDSIKLFILVVINLATSDSFGHKRYYGRT